MTTTPPKFVVKIPEKHITEKIEHSAKQCANMEFREILCPYCDTPLVTVTVSMREGILVAKCQKCKAATPLNLAYSPQKPISVHRYILPSKDKN